MKKNQLQNCYIYRKFINEDHKRLMSKIQQIKNRRTLHGIDSRLPKLPKVNCHRGQPKQRYKQIEKQNKRLTSVIQTTRSRGSQFCSSRIVLKNSPSKHQKHKAVLTTRDQLSHLSNSLLSGTYSPVLSKRNPSKILRVLGKMKCVNDAPQDVQCFF